jgi:hypothetical protein
MGQATPASRREPTFISSETPALLVPKQRHAECRADLGQGPGHTLQNVHTTNHQSPTTSDSQCGFDLTRVPDSRMFHLFTICSRYVYDMFVYESGPRWTGLQK